jgi:hypothetical protein
MKLAIVVIAAVLLQQSGCDEQAPKPAAQPIHRYPPIRRFENVNTPGSPGVALDTVTGQYCKTWEWTYKASALNGGLDTLPTCLTVYQGTPTFEK